MSPCSLTQAFCSAACHWFGVVACKIHSVRMSFALPVCCTGPAVLLVGLTLFITQAKRLEGAQHGSMTGHLSCFIYLWRLQRLVCIAWKGEPYPKIKYSALFSLQSSVKVYLSWTIKTRALWFYWRSPGAFAGLHLAGTWMSRTVNDWNARRMEKILFKHFKERLWMQIKTKELFPHFWWTFWLTATTYSGLFLCWYWRECVCGWALSLVPTMYGKSRFVCKHLCGESCPTFRKIDF